MKNKTTVLVIVLVTFLLTFMSIFGTTEDSQNQQELVEVSCH